MCECLKCGKPLNRTELEISFCSRCGFPIEEEGEFVDKFLGYNCSKMISIIFPEPEDEGQNEEGEKKKKFLSSFSSFCAGLLWPVWGAEVMGRLKIAPLFFLLVLVLTNKIKNIKYYLYFKKLTFLIDDAFFLRVKINNWWPSFWGDFFWLFPILTN